MLANLLNQASSKNDQHTLSAFDFLDLIIDFNQYVIEKNRLLREKLTLTRLSKKIDIEWIKLNIDQLRAVESIINAMRENDHDLKQLFFLDDLESTKKIFVQNIVMTKFRFEKFIVLVVAFFDITITLLNDDQIAHARFKISLDSNFQNLCDIDKNTNRVEFIKQTKFIFWNEIFMQRKWNMMIVNCIIFDLLDVFENFSFDNKMICFCENFKQILLVCSSKKKDAIVDSCLQKISFWSKIEILRLIINMRLQNFNLNEKKKRDATQFAQKMLDINKEIITFFFENVNKQKASWDHEFIEINSQSKLINILYFDLNHIVSNVKYLSQRVILAIINVNVEIINNLCINRLRDFVVQKWNSNRVVDLEMIEEFSFQCFHHYDETSLSSHKLNLKIDMFVMLLRNIRFFFMCNEIKVRITRIVENVLKIEIIANKFQSTSILISRISLNFKNDEINKSRKKIVSCQFTRRQYLIRSIFVIIINKSQRQFLRYVDINIQTRECFTHDQLYVIIFKVTKKCNLYMIISKIESFIAFKLIQNIQWKKILLSLSISINELDEFS